MHRLIEKFHLDRFLSSGSVLLLDTVVSVIVSVLVLFLSGILFTSDVLNRPTEVCWICGSLVFSVVSFLLFRTHKLIIRHSSLREIGMLGLAVILKGVLLALMVWVLPFADLNSTGIKVVLILDILGTIFVLLSVRVIMLYVYDALKRRSYSYKPRKRVLIYGIGDKSISMVTRLQNSPHYRVVGFLIYGSAPERHLISGFRVFYFKDEKSIVYLRENVGLEAVLFAKGTEAREEQSRLIQYCVSNKIKVLIAPEIDEVVDGRLMNSPVRKIRIEDLLGRDEIRISMDEIMADFKGKTVMVTGAAGSIGSELCRQLATFGISKLVLYDNSETPMHTLRLELEERFPELKFVPIIGDVRLPQRLDFAFRSHHPQVVFHAAAYKHVPLMEENPCEAIYTNVIGSRYVADMCVRYDVEKMVMISTDKAVNPTNIMGCTKRLAEIYVQSLGLAIEQGKVSGKTRFVTTRFGNVLGSNGSVIPRFREQISKGGPVTVTHPDITRFFMTIPEACRLVMEAATMSTGNQIFVFDMGKSVKIDTLARRMIELAGFEPDKDIKIEYTGLRPGEKLYEEVLSDKENTIPTSHERILVAKVREYDYSTACGVCGSLLSLSQAVDIPSAVLLMKRTVPEFKSKNSPYEQYDLRIERERQAAGQQPS
jgi:FlaA1/EpsC-like NDP-sugar epimerase